MTIFKITLHLKEDKILHGIQFTRQEDVDDFVHLCYFMPNYIKVDVKKEDN